MFHTVPICYYMRALLFILARIICLGGVWMHPRFVLFRGIYHNLIWFDLVTDDGCNPRLSQVRELATPFEEWGHPSYYLIIWEVSPLYDYEDMIRCDMWCDVICGLVVDYCPKPYSLFPFPISHSLWYACSFPFSFVSVYYIYLFTGLFKLSRTFSFRVRQVFRWKLGYEWREPQT